MGKSKIYHGEQQLKLDKKRVKGSFVRINNEDFYKIANFDQMPDFFMTVVSNSDHWMYLSSNGSLSAGRKDRNNALFPYYTDDKIHDYHGKTGSDTLIQLLDDKKILHWEPFKKEFSSFYSLERNIYKSIYGNKVIFEELNHDLGLKFSYVWSNSERFGWIKKSKIENISNTFRKIKILDGIRNILPYGIDYYFQNEYSNLSDAYKKSELLKESQLGMFMLSSIPVDRAEPSEALKCTTLWSHIPGREAKILISDKQLDSFKQGQEVQTEIDIRASKGAYYVNLDLLLNENITQEWYFAAELQQEISDVVKLDNYLKDSKSIEKDLLEDIKEGTRDLIRIVAAADGLQIGNEELPAARHFSNTLYNLMRGGTFVNHYHIDKEDLILYISQNNKRLILDHKFLLDTLSEKITYQELIAWAENSNSATLERICLEYLPLNFSRRHGDPSRPWNQFAIELKNEDGSPKLNYQGNWRDIFQNWEALALSYPGFLHGMITKFLNASTPDGYNPYRITREGIDWESPDPDDPWAYIGYWGDHQIIYLQKFFEHADAFFPGLLKDLFSKRIFVYANVPYRIKNFNEISEDPKDTIEFDHELNDELQDLFNKIGADGKLLRDESGAIQKANMIEKVLVTILAKLSNFIPEAGIWLNTQRPEWNDANNALVGNGVSMVTLYYIRRLLTFWLLKFQSLESEKIEVAEEIHQHFIQIYDAFNEEKEHVSTGFCDEDRFVLSQKLGLAGEKYRNGIYESGFSGTRIDLSYRDLTSFCERVISFIDQSIEKNERNDGLYHAYNLASFSEKSISIRYLYEMLEGQVAVLSSGFLSVRQSLKLLDALKKSKMFREDQFSYLLFPDRELSRFVEKNTFSKEKIESSILLKELMNASNKDIVIRDENGMYHFNGLFRNAMELSSALDQLDAELYSSLDDKNKEEVLKLYEEIFDHQSFTGRSGTFYGYEGLGSIYWHMVSKLLLAVQEVYLQGIELGEEDVLLNKLKDHYYEIKAGIGLYKSPDVYGAFPIDAYSHTPGGAGVKQPGLTGQVKEDVISRIFELGIRIVEGKIQFNPSLLNSNEILKKKKEFDMFEMDGKERIFSLDQGDMAFTFCQLPVVYHFGKREGLSLYLKDGYVMKLNEMTLTSEISNKVFNRTGEIDRIECFFPAPE